MIVTLGLTLGLPALCVGQLGRCDRVVAALALKLVRRLP